MISVFIDFEARSELNISERRKSIPPSSTYDYACHPSTEVLSLAWAIDRGPVEGFLYRISNERDEGLFGVRGGETGNLRELQPLLALVASGTAQLIAHHAHFDFCMWNYYCVPMWGFPAAPIEFWDCSMARACHFGAPRGLDDAAKFFDLSGKQGGDIVHKLCMPTTKWYNTGKGDKWAGTPADFKKLLEYNKVDVDVMRRLWNHCPPLPESERDVWVADQEVNLRGVYVDVDLARKCRDIAAREAAKLNSEISVLTGGMITTTGQRDRILRFLASRGVRLPNCQQPTLEEALETVTDAKAKAVINFRLNGMGAATSKFNAMANRASPDGRLRGEFAYYGGRTGRWSSRGVQLQNAVKPTKWFDAETIEALIPLIKAGDIASGLLYGTPRELLNALVRPALQAAPGHLLVCLDYSAIEARITAWLSREYSKLQIYIDGRDPYMELAKHISQSNPNRQLGKAGELSLGFGATNVDNFREACKKKFGVIVDAETANLIIDTFHAANPNIKRYWYTLFDGFKTALRNPGQVVNCDRINWKYSREHDVVAMILPSGRCVYYHKPRLDPKPSYWGRLGQDEKGAIGRVHLWHGKTIENAVQAIAADIQRTALVRLFRELPQAPVVLHSHDEQVTEPREEIAHEIYEKQKAIMIRHEPWMEGLPLDADGWIGVNYRKD